jgi:hypothetical protein
VLLGEHRHAEGERVHAGEHLPARAQHPGDLGHEGLSGQVPRQRAVLGDDAVRAAVGEELQPEAVGCDGTQPPAARRRRWLGAGSDDAQHGVARAGGHLGG